MNSTQIRERFLSFFEKRGHAVIPSASLITSDEKGITNPTLFNTAGMQPLIPYLLGKPHPRGLRLVDYQKCLRTVDIDNIGDKTHATFFEMLGNWSLGDYFKKEAIGWSYEFLTSKSSLIGDAGLGLDPNRLYITVFEGDQNAERDDEAADIWREIFKKNNIGGERIFFFGAQSNWWQAGDNGPCGPDSEMFYDITNKFGGKGLTRDEFLEADTNRDVVEVWNDVFMKYEKKDGKIVGNLPKPSIDTGAGLERLAMTMKGVDNIFETDLFSNAMETIRGICATWNLKSARIVADHVRAAVFLVGDGVVPSNTDRGYVLRKLIRRAVSHSTKLGMKRSDTLSSLSVVANGFIDQYATLYPELKSHQSKIQSEIQEEEERFRLTLDKGLKEFEKGVDAFTLFSSYGFPLELTVELAKQSGRTIDQGDFETKFKAHQALSRTGAEQKFKGGLADANDSMVVRYHTATHLLHQALSDVLGESVRQKGSNITTERLRFDFAHNAKMTDEQKKLVENIVNEKIIAKLPVQNVIMSRKDAEMTGAKHFFGEKYGDQISIYFIGDDISTAYSKEFCGGPHVKNTTELSGENGNLRFVIQKEEAVSQGVRRIKAVLR